MGSLIGQSPYRFSCNAHNRWESECVCVSWGVPDHGWQEETYCFDEGKTKFVSANIAPGISITHSFGSFRHDYHSTIDFRFPVAILGFGICGTNSYAVGRHAQGGALRPGDIYLYRPDGSKTIRHTPAQRDCQSAAIKFDISRIAHVLEELEDIGQSPTNAMETALRLAENMNIHRVLQPLLTNPFASAMDKLMGESAALSILASSLANRPAQTVSPQGSLSLSERKSLSRAIDLLLSDLTSPPSLDALSAEAGMSHTRLNRCFRKAYGCTVFAWLRDYRLEAAKTYLHQGHHSITDIAFLCGFSSASHFGAAFRSKYGCTPQDFRIMRIA